MFNCIFSAVQLPQIWMNLGSGWNLDTILQKNFLSSDGKLLYCRDNITENLGKFETFQHKQVEECSQLSQQLEVNIG